MLETCQPETFTNQHQLSPEHFSSLHNKEKWTLFLNALITKYLRVDTIDLFTNLKRHSAWEPPSRELWGNHIFYLTHGSEAPKAKKVIMM